MSFNGPELLTEIAYGQVHQGTTPLSLGQVLGFVGGALLSFFGDSGEEDSWVLEAKDAVMRNAGLVLGGRGPPERFMPSGSVNVAVNSGYMTMDPSTTPTSGNPASFEVEQKYVSEHNEDDLTPAIVALRLMARRSSALRRPPKMRLSYGPFDEVVWISSWGCEFPKGMWPGTTFPRVLILRFTATVVREHELKLASLPPRETTYHTFGDGETFEFVAGTYHGDPNLGVLLRRINPDVLEESPGVVVKVLDLNHPKMLEPVSPAAPCFLSDLAAVQEIAAARTGASNRVWTSLGDMAEVTDAAPVLYGG